MSFTSALLSLNKTSTVHVPTIYYLWNIPPSWKLIAQMPFGKPTAWPEPKPEGNYNGMKKELKERLRVLRASG